MPSATYEIRRAYAVLGLKPGTRLGQVRRRYKALVKRWHPDRYAADPMNQAEAGNRMREINAAYRRLAEMLAPERPQPESSVATKAPERVRLSRDEIENMIRAVGSEGPIDGLLNAIGWIGGTIEGVFALLFAVACVVRLVMLISRGNFSAILEDPALLLFLGFIILMLGHEYLERRKLERGQ